MNYYLEYGGGLGDVFYQMYQDGSYSVLDELGSDDRITVVLITHNPYVRELFDYHPKAKQIEVKDLGYWLPEQDLEMRKHHGLPLLKPPLPVSSKHVEFYPAPSDFPIIEQFCGKPYIVFSVSAGLPDRDVPMDLTKNLVREVRVRSLLPVFVGRNFNRFGRSEYRPEGDDLIDLIDKLTVPGVASVVQGAAGVVCCHSAISILSWLLRKPQLLLYPQSAYQQHIIHRDQWAFGIDFPECWHARFDNPDIKVVAKEFFDKISEQRQVFARMSLTILERRNKNMKTIPLPPESQTIKIDVSIDRLTPPHEVKFLCWLAHQIKGNVVEIGCNKGLTTRDIANTNPDKIIYAVDYFGADKSMTAQQESERPLPQDFCVHTRGMQNVVCVNAKSAELNYEALRKVKLIFIDGDHSFDSVKADTEAALAHLQRHGGGVLVWHDYYAGAPDWVGVKQYVDSLNLEIEQVEGTWLALAKVKGKRRSR